MKHPGHEKKKKELGKLIQRLRTKKGLSRSELISRCHKAKFRTEDDYNPDEVPNEPWLTRLERGTGAAYTLQQINLLLLVLDPSPQQRIELLLVAELPLTSEPEGEVTPEGCLLSVAYSHLMSSQFVKRAVCKYIQSISDQEISEAKLYLDTLQIAVQAGHEELARKERNQQGPTRKIKASAMLSGAD